MKKVVLIILDSVGIGALPDAFKYGDVGSNTLGNIYKRVTGFELKNIEKMGLGNIEGVDFVSKSKNTNASFGRMIEKSVGKDTTTGHWEMVGIVMNKPFPLYPNGFPRLILDEFEDKISSKIIGNYSASGTEIIKDLGDEHLRTKKPIVYTSGDSVFQIAAHEDIISVDVLYDYCKIARKLLTGEHSVARVIARPFKGESGNYVRTNKRKDFSLKPTKKIILEELITKKYDVYGVGKIYDIFSGVGISKSIYTSNNRDGIDQTISLMKQKINGLIFTNLVDFDMLYGHRNDYIGYSNALKYFDSKLPEIFKELNDDDMLIITADHGCDPTFKGTDHTREYVPILIYGKKLLKGIDIGTRNSFADVGKTILDFFEVENDFYGESIMERLEIKE